MPRTHVRFYKDDDGSAPVLEWLADLCKKDSKGFVNCYDKIDLLREYGYELDRPSVGTLRDGIYELRAKHVHVQYRILFFHYKSDITILCHSFIKAGSRVPDKDIDLAIERKRNYERDPEGHTYEKEQNQ